MLTPEELEESRLKSLKICEQSYLMYENSKKEMVEVAAKKTDKNGAPVYTEQAIKKNLQLLEEAQKDVVAQYLQMGGKMEDLTKLTKKKKNTVDRKHLEEIMKAQTAKADLAKYINEMHNSDIKDVNVTNEVDNNANKNENITQQPTLDTYNVSEVGNLYFQQPITSQETPNLMPGSNKMFDVVKLPSKGQCYRSKKDKLKVGYLTAYDENMILSPNLYKDGKFIDYLLRSKILDNDFNIDELTKGDRDAIILWLRATGYGNEYPIVVTDDETNKEFETTVDLSKLNYKPFKLKGDINGYFDFTLPSSNDIVKFKFLSIKDLELLERLKAEENKKIAVLNIKRICSDLMDATRDSDLISFTAQQKIKTSVETVREEINKNYDEENDLSFSHELTDRLLLQTVSINGISDRKYIENYIFSMNVKDAAAYRKYILDNEPGVDFNIEVERPESLGGGSIKSFLRLDQFIFINV